MSQVSKYHLDKELYEEFLTPNERVMFSKRIAAGLLIAEGHDYRQISEQLKISASTISTFSLLYKYGSSYKQIIDRVKLDKSVQSFLLLIGEKISSLNSFGGKGSQTWRLIHKDIEKKRSKLLR